MTGPAVPSGLEALLAQATSGPWDASFEAGDEWWFGGDDGGQAVIRPASGPAWESVCVMGGEQKADALLIALAPDMARLLIDMAEAMNGAPRTSGRRVRRYGADPSMGRWYSQLDALLARFADLQRNAT